MFGYTFYNSHILKKRRNLKRDARNAVALYFFRLLYERGVPMEAQGGQGL